MRRVEVTEHEVTSRRGLRVTSAMRTVCDLGSRPDPVEAVVAIDMALHEELIDSAALGREVDERRGAKEYAGSDVPSPLRTGGPSRRWKRASESR